MPGSPLVPYSQPMARPQLEMPPVWAPGAPPPGAVTPPKKGPKAFAVYHDNAVPLWSQWDVPTALMALDAHTLGQFYSSSLLGDAMGIDDSFDAVMQTRILGLISRPFELRRSQRGNGHKSRVALREIRDRWDEIFPEDVQANLMHAYLLMGFAPAQIIWRYEEKKWLPQIQPWHAGTVYYDISTRSYVANTMEGPVYLRPGDGRWILMTPFGAYRGWMRGAVRAVCIPFLARQYALRDWARYNEVHGLPIKVGKVPSRALASEKIEFTNALANLGNEAAIVLPQGLDGESFDLQLLEAKADTHEAFLDLISKCEERIAIRLLGQNLTTSVDAGSLAAANVHDRVRLDYVRFDAKAMGTLREQVLRAFCQFNYGDPDVAPELVWNCTPPEDKMQRATSLAQISASLVNFAQVGAPVDMRKYLERNDIPMVDAEEGADPITPKMMPLPAPAGGAGGASGAAPKVAKAPAKPPKQLKEVRAAERKTLAVVEKLGRQVEALAKKDTRPAKPVGPTFAQRNAAFLADLKDHRDLDLEPDMQMLAKQHGVPIPKAKANG